MRRDLCAVLVLALLGGCAAPKPAPLASAAPVCRAGPDGAPPAGSLADKGIGGTGGPALADKGIGGTGIIAVITGFASICLGGEEVALPANTPVQLGGEAGDPAALRTGQVALVEARPAGGGLAAGRVAIRYEVSGPVEQVTADGLVVAGQRVLMTAATLGVRPRPGDWVSISGLRRDAAIVATRIDPRAPGPVTVIGRLQPAMNGWRIGALPIAPDPAFVPGQEVIVTGPLLLGALQPVSVVRDLLATDPAAYFGPAIDTVLIEAYAAVDGRRLRLGNGLGVPTAETFVPGLHRGVFRLERAGSGLRAIGERTGFGPAPVAHEPFTPAPTPDRGLRRPGGATGAEFGQPFRGRGSAGRMGDAPGTGQEGTPNTGSGGPSFDRSGPRGR